ncbi:virulence factor TspB C-terminal domain-related protein [Acinetobacter baumannii]|uniref:virulence factor TspB C-terminal domain-related protein n=1 Tax=Acinetobacter baumannii TaxID=470 RepID=UPI00224F63CB|nr:virulence factor TspB C-terminal domain-related protein [Acinetobacter baumannii]MCX3054546.1 virulence factor TspB C-terminal domain-related protein [Acinetobacter baumannii]
MRKLLKQINVIILSFVLIFAPTYVFATSVSAEGWSVTKRLVQGATTFYDGTKNIVLNGKNYAATGAAAITPTAAQVSKMIVRTGAVLAVDLAIKALIGAVDYTMDPANNQVKYKVINDPNSIPPYAQYYYADPTRTKFCTSIATCNIVVSEMAKPNGWTNTGCVAESTGRLACRLTRDSSSTTQYMDRYVNPNYDPNAVPNEEERTLPYSAVASQIISDAVANKADGKAYVSSVADTALEEDEQKQIVPASDVANQLNNSQSIPTSNTAQGAATPKPIEGTPDPTQPQPTPYDITINFPIFCSWAPSVCQAAQVAINFPAKVDKWIEGLFYNTKGLPEYDNKTDLFIHEQPEIKHVSINWGSVCPAPVTVPLSFMGISREITVVNYQYICDYAWIIKASVNMVASISAVYIVAGRKE